MATETRVLRPFASPAVLQDVLDRTTLRVGTQQLDAGGRIVVDHYEFLHLPVTLRLGGEVGLTKEDVVEVESALNEMGVPHEDAVLAVNLYSGFLKISEYVHEIPLSEMSSLPRELSIASPGHRPSALRAPYSGCRVEVAFLLARTLKQSPGKPWRKGTWLSRSRYAISCDVEFQGFTPRPMDADQKAQLGVPPKAMRYVTLPAGIDPVVDALAPDSIELWVDSGLLGLLAAQPKSRESIALQRQLFVDAFAAVVAAALPSLIQNNSTWADVEESMIGGLVASLASGGKKNPTERTELCERYLHSLSSDPAKFMANVEAHVGLTDAFVKVFEGES